MLPDATIGIDLGTHCGWAVLDPNGGRVGSGTWRLGSGRRRWLVMREAAVDLIQQHVFSEGAGRVVVCYEAVEWVSTTKAAHVYGGLKAILEMATLDLGVRCVSLHSQQWKKIATGKGNADKAAYTSAASQRFALDLSVKAHEDEAAALGIAYACLRELGGPDMPVSGQQKVLV